MPLPNWRKEDIQVSVVDAGQVNPRIRSLKLWKRASSMRGRDHILVDYFEFTNGDEEAAHFKNPKDFTERAVPDYKVDVTPTKPAVVNFEFCIYASPAPKDTHLPLTPLRRPPVRDIGFTLLKNASERVGEILRENRRRLDAGEDPNTIRREARRKRAMELSAARKGRTNPSSLS